MFCGQPQFTFAFTLNSPPWLSFTNTVAATLIKISQTKKIARVG